jgi:hypothetical protein
MLLDRGIAVPHTGTMRSHAGRAGLVLCTLALLPWALQGREPQNRSTFASTIDRLSEPEGAFDTDNLISNERGYVDVVPALVTRGITGGAYIGVGPDQNFTYIARIRPTVAYIIDVRRDNLLLHLLFKALFGEARSRVEYLSLLTGRAPPPPSAAWATATVERIADYVDGTAPTTALADLRRRIEAAVVGFGVPLSARDLSTIHRFHRAFIDGGLGLQFNSHGRRPQFYYPTFRELLLARDAAGRAWSYLASEADFQFVRALEARDRVIPVVGNVNGPHALRAIGQAIAARGERVSAFYISNVENYLHRDGTFPRYVENIARLPRDDRTVIIRSMFNGGGSISVVEPLRQTLARSGAVLR